MHLISGNSNKILADKIASYLNIDVCDTEISKFKDSEIFVEIKESLQGGDVFFVQSIANPTSENIMELLIGVDALKRSSAKRITAVIPYYGYGRQDRRIGKRTSIPAKLLANLITCAGADRVLSLDLHTMQIQGFFDIPIDNLYASPVFISDIIRDNIDYIIVSPDIGGVSRARNLAEQLNTGLVIVDKRREAPGSSEVINVIGDVQNKECIIIDDIIDSGCTIIKAAEALYANGAKSVKAYVTHAVLSGDAIERINDSCLDELIITDSIDLKIVSGNKIRIISVASLIAEAIKRISEEGSVSSLFN